MGNQWVRIETELNYSLDCTTHVDILNCWKNSELELKWSHHAMDSGSKTGCYCGRTTYGLIKTKRLEKMMYYWLGNKVG